jgi:preprotein translocase subunit SecF
MSTSSKPVKGSTRPGRALLALALMFVTLGATVAITGATEVRLGLDLRGGTSVTLQPRASTAGNDVTPEAINQAVEIQYTVTSQLNLVPYIIFKQKIRADWCFTILQTSCQTVMQ